MTFVSASPYRESLEEVGCSYVPLEGYANFTAADFPTMFAGRHSYPPGPLQIAYDIEHVFIKPIQGQHEALQRALVMLTEKHPGRPIVQLCEGMFQGAHPISLGAPGIRPAGTVGIGIIPLALTSVDCAPFGPGLPPDSSPEGRLKNKAMSSEVNEAFWGNGQKIWSKILTELGADPSGTPLFLDATYLAQDRFLQMCIPSIEYPRSDAPSTIKFTGGLPKGTRDPMTSAPAWWNEVIENKDKKDIIFICQGTVARNYTQLIIPTIEALATRENTLVIAALGTKGDSLPEDMVIPDNARVIDFLPFDEILPFTTVFVTNGGYGALQHAIANGTPLLMGGAGEDKPEVSRRAEWAGCAYNLETATPTKEAIKFGVEAVISDPKYKLRAKELQAEMAEFDPVGVVIETIEELAAGKAS